MLVLFLLFSNHSLMWHRREDIGLDGLLAWPAWLFLCSSNRRWKPAPIWSKPGMKRVRTGQNIIKASSKFLDAKRDAQVMEFMCHEPDGSRKHQTDRIRADWCHASSSCLLRQFGPKWVLDTLSDPSCPPWTQLLCRKRDYPREMYSYGRSKHSCSSPLNKLIMTISVTQILTSAFFLVKTTARHLVPPYGEHSSTWCPLPTEEVFGCVCFHISLTMQESRICQSTLEARKKNR